MRTYRFCSDLCFFFKHEPAYELRISDWSSDVCSSVLREADPLREVGSRAVEPVDERRAHGARLVVTLASRARFGQRVAAGKRHPLKATPVISCERVDRKSVV